eukprot:COSAG02_NODE_21_length_53083_cov_95.733618_33_plen_157_part_00
MDEDDPFLAVDVLFNECVIECRTRADHRARCVVVARAIAVLRSITGRKAGTALFSAGSSTREEEPRLAVAVAVPDRVHAGRSIRSVQQLVLTVVARLARFVPVPREVFRIGFVCSSWSLFPDHRTTAYGGRDVAIHHDNVVVVIVDVIAPDTRGLD